LARAKNIAEESAVAGSASNASDWLASRFAGVGRALLGVVVVGDEVAEDEEPRPLTACHRSKPGKPLGVSVGIGPEAEEPSGAEAPPEPPPPPPPFGEVAAAPPDADCPPELPSGSANGSTNGLVKLAVTGAALAEVGAELVPPDGPPLDVLADTVMLVVGGGAGDEDEVLPPVAVVTGTLPPPLVVPPDEAPRTPPSSEPGGLRSSRTSTARRERNTVVRRGCFQPRSHWERRRDERFQAMRAPSWGLQRSF
jgi:hypothetical protein